MASRTQKWRVHGNCAEDSTNSPGSYTKHVYRIDNPIHDGPHHPAVSNVARNHTNSTAELKRPIPPVTRIVLPTFSFLVTISILCICLYAIFCISPNFVFRQLVRDHNGFHSRFLHDSFKGFYIFVNVMNTHLFALPSKWKGIFWGLAN